MQPQTLSVRGLCGPDPEGHWAMPGAVGHFQSTEKGPQAILSTRSCVCGVSLPYSGVLVKAAIAWGGVGRAVGFWVGVTVPLRRLKLL